MRNEISFNENYKDYLEVNHYQNKTKNQLALEKENVSYQDKSNDNCNYFYNSILNKTKALSINDNNKNFEDLNYKYFTERGTSNCKINSNFSPQNLNKIVVNPETHDYWEKRKTKRQEKIETVRLERDIKELKELKFTPAINSYSDKLTKSFSNFVNTNNVFERLALKSHPLFLKGKNKIVGYKERFSRMNKKKILSKADKQRVVSPKRNKFNSQESNLREFISNKSEGKENNTIKNQESYNEGYDYCFKIPAFIKNQERNKLFRSSSQSPMNNYYRDQNISLYKSLSKGKITKEKLSDLNYQYGSERLANKSFNSDIYLNEKSSPNNFNQSQSQSKNDFENSHRKNKLYFSYSNFSNFEDSQNYENSTKQNDSKGFNKNNNYNNTDQQGFEVLEKHAFNPKINYKPIVPGVYTKTALESIFGSTMSSKKESLLDSTKKNLISSSNIFKEKSQLTKEPKFSTIKITKSKINTQNSPMQKEKNEDVMKIRRKLHHYLTIFNDNTTIVKN